MSAAGLPSFVQRFFTRRLLEQQGLALTWWQATATRSCCRWPSPRSMPGAPPNLQMEKLDVALIEKLLRRLEQDRGNSVRKRNSRLAAAHAFFRFVAISEPALGLQCQHILVIPSKRREHGPVEFLTAGEAAALVAAPDARTCIASRDRPLLLVAVQTGLRNCELISLMRPCVVLGTGAHVCCLGKYRKMRCTPLRPDVILYSRGESCRANRVDIYRYLTDLFKALPYAKSAHDYSALLPRNLGKPERDVLT